MLLGIQKRAQRPGDCSSTATSNKEIVDGEGKPTEKASTVPGGGATGPPAADTEPPPTVTPEGRFSRRQLLKAAGTGSATVVVAGIGMGSYRVYDTGVLDPGGGRAYEPWQQWRDNPGPLGAVAASILAASPHNTQPWQFQISENGSGGPDAIDVFVDPARGTGALDPMQREQYVGLGCALENLALACRARGLLPAIELLPDGPKAARVAHVTLMPGQPATDHQLYDAIGHRHTNRGPYEAKPVPVESLTALVDSSGLPGVLVHWVTDAAQTAALGRLLVDAAAAVTADDQQSRDSFAWFRSNNDAVQRHRDGLTLDAQGLSPLILSVAKLLPASSRSTGDKFWVDQTRTVHTRAGVTYGVLTAVNTNDRRTQLLGGRLLQRIHLSATARGIALHHMNQITERIDRERSIGAAATFQRRFAELLPPATQPLVAFRVGYPLRQGGLSPRRPVPAVTR